MGAERRHSFLPKQFLCCYARLLWLWGTSVVRLSDEETEALENTVSEQYQPHRAIWKCVGMFGVVRETKQTRLAFTGWWPGMLSFLKCPRQ